jgi:hypothetical protein
LSIRSQFVSAPATVQILEPTAGNIGLSPPNYTEDQAANAIWIFSGIFVAIGLAMASSFACERWFNGPKNRGNEYEALYQHPD